MYNVALLYLFCTLSRCNYRLSLWKRRNRPCRYASLCLSSSVGRSLWASIVRPISVVTYGKPLMVWAGSVCRYGSSVIHNTSTALHPPEIGNNWRRCGSTTYLPHPFRSQVSSLVCQASIPASIQVPDLSCYKWYPYTISGLGYSHLPSVVPTSVHGLWMHHVYSWVEHNHFSSPQWRSVILLFSK